MRDLPIAAQVYIISLSILAALTSVLAVRVSVSAHVDFRLVVLFAALICLAELSPTVVQPHQVEVTVSPIMTIAALFLFAWPVGFLSQLLGTFMAELRAARPWYKRLFNADLALLYALLGSASQRLFGTLGPNSTLVTAIGGTLFMAVGYAVLNNGLVTVAIVLSEQLSPLYVWKTNFSNMVGQEVAMPVLGLIFAILWRFAPWSVALMILPLWVVRSSVKLIVDLRYQTERALLAFADAIDARDPLTYRHSQRVAEHAVEIARQMGLPQNEIDVIYQSARLHDLGKVGITDQWLHKEGPLSSEEMAQFRRHAMLGAEMVDHFSLFNAGEELIRGHHERYDGQGYPDGKRGRDIPLGARIIAVADAYDAMISQRPYRPPMSNEQAILNLRRGAGTQFDPRVVEVAVSALSRGTREQPASTVHQEAMAVLPIATE